MITECHVLHTDAYITDAMLGTGEALDCFNQIVEDAASIKSGLENIKLLQAIALVESLNTAEEKVSAYNRLFGTCCSNISEVIQSIAKQVIPLIATSGSGSSGGDTTPPINPNPENPPA